MDGLPEGGAAFATMHPATGQLATTRIAAPTPSLDVKAFYSVLEKYRKSSSTGRG